jgi:hypothetical protein
VVPQIGGLNKHVAEKKSTLRSVVRSRRLMVAEGDDMAAGDGSRWLAGRWARSRTARVASGLTAGTACGLTVFSLTQLEGMPLFLLTGALAGLISALVAQLWSLSAQLTEVKVMIPRVSEFHFAVNRDVRQVAWRLFVETSTRVSTQPLDDESGLLREAMTSLYSLYQTVREELRSGQPTSPRAQGQNVEELAIAMLNRELRPFLSRWHLRLSAWERQHAGQDESAWPENAACRRDLKQLQEQMRSYLHGYAKIAGVHDVDKLLNQNIGPSGEQRTAPQR